MLGLSSMSTSAGYRHRVSDEIFARSAPRTTLEVHSQYCTLPARLYCFIAQLLDASPVILSLVHPKSGLQQLKAASHGRAHNSIHTTPARAPRVTPSQTACVHSPCQVTSSADLSNKNRCLVSVFLARSSHKLLIWPARAHLVRHQLATSRQRQETTTPPEAEGSIAEKLLVKPTSATRSEQSRDTKVSCGQRLLQEERASCAQYQPVN